MVTQMKASLLDSTSSVEHSTITDEAAGSAYVENFAMKVFLQADDEDRAGKASKATVRKFVVAAQFMEVLRCFDPPNGMREELEQKLQYARWKAADIAKALKEGRTPTPGPRKSFSLSFSSRDADLNNVIAAGEEADEEQDLPPAQSPQDDESLQKTLPALPGTSSPAEPHPSTSQSEHTAHVPPPLGRQDSTNSGTWSTVVTPGIESASASGAFTLPSAPTAVDKPPPPMTTRRHSAGGLRQDRGEGHEKKEVRFAGPDGAPLSPSATVVTLDSYTAPDAPPSSEFMEPEPTPDSGLPDLPLPPTSKLESRDTERSTADDEAVLFPTTPSAKPTTMPNLPSAPPTEPSHTRPPPSAPEDVAPEYPTSLDSKSIERCQKHARWAISALDYEDLETARKELRLALDLLEGR
ncbi:hypothetical protein QFC19_001376 [Naganishia cerealis]|uniref:Uncharacterized protein n=1 Tax=Naganishia cerealis TaxID=610337 RepID=A0ACC2WJY6_9TREE|nr:hypothetical protein QFC19_001376 [Naganishia cerealis]